MAKLSRLTGSTSHVLLIFVQDSSKTDGSGLAGLAFGTSGLACYYKRNLATSSTAVTLVTITTLGTYASGGFKEVDATNMPGVYEFHPPDAAYAAGAKSVVFILRGATNMAPVLIEVELTAVDNQSAAFGLSLAKTTNITGFNDIASTAIVSGGAITTSGGKAAATLAAADVTGNVAADVQTVKTQTVTCAAGVTVLASVGTATANTAQTGDSFARLGAAGAGLTAIGDTRLAHLDADVSSRSTFAGLGSTAPAAWINTAAFAAGATVPRVTLADTLTANGDKAGYSLAVAPPTASAVAAAVRDVDNTTPAASSLGAKVNSAASAGDPWATSLPGSYSAGTAGAIVGTNLNATVSSRSTYAGGAVASVTGTVNATLVSAGLDAITVESGVNARQALSPILAACAGVLGGAGTGTIVVKGGAVATTRITATTDSSGNRSVVTLNLPT